jgi:hypothetical protein
MTQNQRQINDFIKSLTQDDDFIQDLWVFYLTNSATEEELTQYFNKIKTFSKVDNILNNVPVDIVEAIGNKINHLSMIEQQVLMLYLLGVNVEKICNVFYRIEKSKLLQLIATNGDII